MEFDVPFQCPMSRFDDFRKTAMTDTETTDPALSGSASV
jgi:hypothetical protein